MRFPAPFLLGALLVLALLEAGVAASQDCISLLKNRCMKKSEVGPFAGMMSDGDPCFSNSGARFCIVKVEGMSASMDPCSCSKPNCGCSGGGGGGGVSSTPTCDNSEVPKSFQCDTGSSGYCADSYTDKKGNKNTMCKYCGVNQKNCGKVCQYGLSEDEKKGVLDKHNELRSKVARGKVKLGVNGGQPKAANMFKLSWDDELAKVAQRWADQCVGGHDKNRNTKTFPYVGQNYAAKMASWLSFTNNNVTGMVLDWFSEVKDFPGANVEKFSTEGATGVVGHYTQVAWGSTKKVGCGFIQQYPYKYAGGTWYRRMMICNYGPGGNVLGQEMYAKGKPGSKCPGKSEKGLCL